MGRMKDELGDDLFGEAYARATDPFTSHAAAVSLRGEEANRIEGLVADALKRHPAGLICDELVAILRLNWNTVSPRLRPLANKGIIAEKRDAGRIVKRQGKSRRGQIVWIYKAF